ncbi:MAG: hypothetical protein JXR76_10275 [Deltaproteobacteria bacterium]|nr:hypothetical protein [Deltaproteobacteria bacterium]
MKRMVAVLCLLMLGGAGCDGEFWDLSEDTDAAKLKNADTSSAKDTDSRASLPANCGTGETLCYDDAVNLCVLGNWRLVMDCRVSGARCSETSGDARCVATTPVGNPGADDDSETIPIAGCALTDDNCFNHPGYPCSDADAGAELDCVGWAVLYGPCAGVAQDCWSDAACAELEQCINAGVVSGDDEEARLLCLVTAGDTATATYWSYQSCVYCSACDRACAAYVADGYCDGA